MSVPIEPLLRASPLFRRLSEHDRRSLAEVSQLRTYPKGETIFSEGDPSDFLYTLVEGRVKVVKMLAAGKEVILEILGPGDALGAVAVYESRPYPASAVAIVFALACLSTSMPTAGWPLSRPTDVDFLYVSTTVATSRK